MNRRSLAALAVIPAAGLALAACGSSGGIITKAAVPQNAAAVLAADGYPAQMQGVHDLPGVPASWDQSWAAGERGSVAELVVVLTPAGLASIGKPSLDYTDPYGVHYTLTGQVLKLSGTMTAVLSDPFNFG